MQLLLFPDDPRLQTWAGSVDWTGIPDSIRYELTNWVERAQRPGAFLTAVLANDLVGAVLYADTVNRRWFQRIVTFVYSELPGASRGSAEAVLAWRGLQ